MPRRPNLDRNPTAALVNGYAGVIDSPPADNEHVMGVRTPIPVVLERRYFPPSQHDLER